ncbi:unnamed protein product [Rotaria sordida]|uniref:Luciferase domain-containing protein n=1 Tax=Rotaria sordida TaxID=392033 RepID=A0A815CXJ5_9BILA|nr:unnamed protein product [Rotaria sordida]CAF4070332.1 unnamed protein product [Rotaria sordida]
MILLTALVLLVILFVLFKRSYNQYASGLREKPKYFLWLLTCFINFKGWSKESYCLRTDNIKSTDNSGYLNDKDIPVRNQSRPKMLRALPHRQLTQQAPDEIMYEMHKHMESISIPRYGGQTINDQLLLRGPSMVEYTGANALFLPNPNKNTIENGEFAHLHSNDGSFHMMLHPSDAKLLINKQWAEKFPLVGMNLFNKIIIPDSFVLIYAPQNESELNIWKTILNACIDYNRDNKNTH